MSRLLKSSFSGMFLAVLFLAASITVAPTPAQADTWPAAKNLAVNTLFGWAECPKAMADEFGKAPQRFYVGVLVTAPLSCALNTGVRYLGVAADVAAVPLAGKNTVNPGVFDNKAPPIPIP